MVKSKEHGRAGVCGSCKGSLLSPYDSILAWPGTSYGIGRSVVSLSVPTSPQADTPVHFVSDIIEPVRASKPRHAEGCDSTDIA
jgi:hypothetical protein